MITRLRFEAEKKVREKFNLPQDIGLDWSRFSHMEPNLWEVYWEEMPTDLDVPEGKVSMPLTYSTGVLFNEDGTVKEVEDLPEE